MGIARRTAPLLAALVVALNLSASSQELARPSGTNQGVADRTLNGHYAFAFNGFVNGSPIIMAGAFVADGAGHLTSGVVDVNDGSGEPVSNHNVVPQTLMAGSVYSLTASRLGTMTMVTNVATYKFKVVISPNACAVNSQFLSTCGRLIESDPANPQNYGSGVIKVQNASYFSIANFFPGNFALQITGTDSSGKRYAGAGALGTNSVTLVDIDCSTNGWGLDGCPLDINDNGRSGSERVKGTFAATLDHNTGRGPFANFSFPGDPEGFCQGVLGNPGCTYAYYIIDKQQMILISADPISHPANLVLWWAVRQSSPPAGWTLSSLNATTVVELDALDPNAGSPVADVTAGVLSADGSGNASFLSDENHGGTLLQHQFSQGTYSIDSSGQKTGRARLQGFSTQFGDTAPVLYFSAPNMAFVIGTDAKVSSGSLQPQVGAPFSNTSLINTYAGGSISPVASTVRNSAGTFYANGSGSGNTSQYTSGPRGPGGPVLSILTYQADATGRVVVQQGTNLYGIAYVVSATKMFLLPTGDAPALSVFASAPSN